jgi:molecular chaperone Hsp33
LVQVLPKAAREPALVALLEERCQEVRGFSQRLAEHATNLQGLLEDIFPDLDPQPLEQLANRQAVRFQCTCSRDRSVGALQLLGKDELTAVLQEEGHAELTCHFCNEHYVVEAPELEALIQAVS